MTCGVSGFSRGRSLAAQFGWLIVALATVLTLVTPGALSAQGATLEASATVDGSTPAAASDAAVTTSTTPPPIAAEQTASQSSRLDWDMLHRRYSTWSGPTGGLYLLDGRGGEPGAFRAQLALDGFSGSDFLRRGDKIEVSSQSLVLSVTALRSLELFATLNNRATNRLT